MANSIALAARFVPVIDEMYHAQAVTNVLDSSSMNSEFLGVNEIKILKVSTTGLGDYSRENGYPKGDITALWETLTLSEERGKEISLDRMDNEETLGLTFGAVTNGFIRDWVAPELDAYRFAKYASKAGINTVAAAALTSATLLAAIDEAVRQMDADEVPAAGRKLFINSNLKPLLNGALTRTFGSDGVISNVLSGYNDMTIVYVPASRFYTAITLNAGAGSWGYVKEAIAAKNINFMIIYPGAVVQVPKFTLPKIFTPDENQSKDAWLFQFRLYHDAFVYDNKALGVYLHKSTT